MQLFHVLFLCGVVTLIFSQALNPPQIPLQYSVKTTVVFTDTNGTISDQYSTRQVVDNYNNKYLFEYVDGDDTGDHPYYLLQDGSAETGDTVLKYKPFDQGCC